MLDKENYKSLYGFQQVVFNHMKDCKACDEITEQYTLMKNILDEVYASEIKLFPIRQRG